MAWAVPPWYEVGEAIATAWLALFLSSRVWLLLDRRSRVARALRLALRRPGAAHLCWAFAGVCAFFIAAEGVLDSQSEELIRDLDAVARGTVRLLARSPTAHLAAERVSDLTGIGLVGIVAGVVVCLFTMRHRREALIVAVGSVSGWVISGGLKSAIGVPRPHSWHGGFPSGHVVTTVVAGGLVAWCLGRFTSDNARRGLYAAAAAAALLSGASRMVLDAHWLSDVVGGLGAGTALLNVAILIASGFGPAEERTGAPVAPPLTLR
jgi:membrane-associated phospholipid phosphatase